jgi:ubiquinone/menaquinone biosynthesis C-methylase UbiE
MPRDRDVAAFGRRAASYERDWAAGWHSQVTERMADLVLEVAPAPARTLDVGCGTGALLRLLAARLPEAVELVGIDAARGMVAAGRSMPALDPRIELLNAAAERLPLRTASFDVVVSNTSFDHWADQLRGLEECARTLRGDGRLVLADLFAGWLAPTTVLGRRGRARTIRQASRLLVAAGFRDLTWRRLSSLGPLPLVRAVVAAK